MRHPNSRFKIQDPKIQDSEIKIQKSRSENQDPESRSRNQNIEIKIQKSRSRNQDSEMKIP